MIAVSVFRPEAADAWGNHNHLDDPFSGTEILGIFQDEESDWVENEFMTYMTNKYPTWKFSIEPYSDSMRVLKNMIQSGLFL